VVQVDAIKATLKSPGTKRLKVKYDSLLSNSAFKFNLRRYTTGRVAVWLQRWDGEGGLTVDEVTAQAAAGGFEVERVAAEERKTGVRRALYVMVMTPTPQRGNRDGDVGSSNSNTAGAYTRPLSG
jgi:hypothetical protein